MHRGRGARTSASAVSDRSMATRWATISTASAFALKVLAQTGDLVQVRPDPRQLAGALSLHLGVRHGPGARTRPTDRRTRSDSVNPAELAFACHSARSRLAGADLHPHVASSAPHVPLPLGGSEGAQPPASPCQGPAKRGPKG